MTTHINTYPIQDAAKMIGIGSNKLFKLLRAKRILTPTNVPYQSYIDRGLFKVQCGSYEHPTMGTKLYSRTEVTVNGVSWLTKLIEKKKTLEH